MTDVAFVWPPLLRRLSVGEAGLWSRLLERVLRRPVRWAVVVSLPLFFLCAVALQLHLATPDTRRWSSRLSSDSRSCCYSSPSRSIVIAAKAVVLNLLSVGAAYGLLVLVFQHGFGESLLGFESNGGVVPWLPMFLFVVLFGLSMDYHVFILSRVREPVGRGASTEEAVSRAISATAGTVTSAAAVTVAVFAIFATLTPLEMKQLGVGLASAILIDATIVRAGLLPATMKLLGNWNWYLPRWLRWRPRMSRPTIACQRRP